MKEPVRITTREAIALSRLSRATFWRRIAQGRLPGPVDRGRQALFCREAMLRALTAGREQHTSAADLSAAAAALRRRQAALSGLSRTKTKLGNKKP